MVPTLLQSPVNFYLYCIRRSGWQGHMERLAFEPRDGRPNYRSAAGHRPDSAQSCACSPFSCLARPTRLPRCLLHYFSGFTRDDHVWLLPSGLLAKPAG